MARKDQESAAPAAGVRAVSFARRLVGVFRSLPPERRLAAYAALGLFLTLFLPWYSRQFVVLLSGHLVPAADSQNGWQAFSFVEAAVLLVAVGVLVLLFQRAEGRAFHVPGGDGWVITAAGAWTCLLIVWRIFDRQGGSGNNQQFTSWGIRWGIFVALAVAALLAYAGSRIRSAAAPEPPLPGEEDAPAAAPAAAAAAAAAAAPAPAPVAPPPSRRQRSPRATAPTAVQPAPASPAASDYVVRRRRRFDASTLPSSDPPEFAYDRRAGRPPSPRVADSPIPPSRAGGDDRAAGRDDAAAGRDDGTAGGDDQLTMPFDSGD